jgi:hypothetical protein
MFPEIHYKILVYSADGKNMSVKIIKLLCTMKEKFWGGGGNKGLGTQKKTF